MFWIKKSEQPQQPTASPLVARSLPNYVLTVLDSNSVFQYLFHEYNNECLILTTPIADSLLIRAVNV